MRCIFWLLYWPHRHRVRREMDAGLIDVEEIAQGFWESVSGPIPLDKLRRQLRYLLPVMLPRPLVFPVYRRLMWQSYRNQAWLEIVS